MKRRDLILASAGLLVPVLGRAAQPCPPPLVSAANGGTVTTNCPTAPAGGYATNFASTENPISENGKWTNGKAVGLDWNNVQSVPGVAYAAGFVSGYDDPIAVLNTNFGANQFAQGTVRRVAGYAPSVSHEIELLLRFQITAHSARGYEVLWGANGELNIVRWNGPLGNYTPLLATTGPNIGLAVEGDVLRAEIIGSQIKVYRNGALMLTGPADSTYSGGQPGMGFWPKAGATLSSYGWKSYSAGNV